MAKSNSFFSIRRGSTKSHTFSAWQNKQVTKDRVVDVKNPRSASQQAQRMKFAAVGNFYKYLKFILNHSWEGVSYGVNSYSRFMSLNVKNFDTSSMIIPEYGSKVAEAGTYQVSEGSLPQTKSWSLAENDNFGIELSVAGKTEGASASYTVDDLLDKLFINDEDYLTLVGLMSTVEPDGSPNVNYQTKGFAVRLHKPTAASTTVVTSDNFFTLTSAEFIGLKDDDFAVAITPGSEGFAPILNISTSGVYILCFGFIGSKSDGNSSSAVLRSTEVLELTAGVVSLVAATNASNSESWPVGADYILNGEATAVLD